jgi:hypothetical protein
VIPQKITPQTKQQSVSPIKPSPLTNSVIAADASPVTGNVCDELNNN